MSNNCVHCSTGESIMESRRDAFNTANGLLKDTGTEHNFEDIMTLACFLLGYREDDE